MSTFVYAVAADHGPVKFGYSADVDRRVTMFQCHSPNLITEVLRVPGGFILEARVKAALAPSVLHGEWFRPTRPVADMVERLRERGAEALLNRAELVLDRFSHCRSHVRRILASRGIDLTVLIERGADPSSADFLAGLLRDNVHPSLPLHVTHPRPSSGAEVAS